MTPDAIQKLNAINRRFYETTAEDFDETRGRAWAGWETLLPHLDESATTLSVLDVGCGNGRFGLFLAEHLDAHIGYTGVDNNRELLQYAQTALDSQDNITATLVQQDVIEDDLPPARDDLVVAFGMIHHVPGRNNRRQFMADLAQRVAPGGLLCFAAWRFYEYERFKERLADWPDDLKALVETHDYLLDWRRGEEALRYCHYVDEDEHQELVNSTGLKHVETFRADGSDGEMNRYSVLRRPL
jgi:SAM-dependent methyltransferase